MARTAAIVLILWMCLPEVLLARVVLEAGEIDSGKVRVGVFAEVVYGKGKRDPVSGQWEKLTTASGYIKAVDAEHLTIALRQGFGKKRIAFARIQKLILAESRGEMAKLKDTLRRRKRPASILRLSEGRRIRIHTRGMEEGIVARVHRATRDTLFFKKRMSILRREKRPEAIALTDISRLEVYKYRESYAKEGAIVGAAAGIAAVLVGHQEAVVPHPILFLMPPIMGLMGGALAGSMLGHDVWQVVDLSPSTVERRRRLSYRLSFRF